MHRKVFNPATPVETVFSLEKTLEGADDLILGRIAIGVDGQRPALLEKGGGRLVEEVILREIEGAVGLTVQIRPGDQSCRMLPPDRQMARRAS